MEDKGNDDWCGLRIITFLAVISVIYAVEAGLQRIIYPRVIKVT